MPISTRLTRLAPVPSAAAAVADVIRLDFDARQRCRQRVRSAAGESLGIVLERGTILQNGDCLEAEDGRVFRIEAELEDLSIVFCPDASSLARAAYHLGNRHSRVQILNGSVCYRADQVLDTMLRQLGLTVVAQRGSFEPEPGAYHAHAESSGQGGASV